MAFITAMVCCPAFTASAADAPVIDTKADQVLRQMSDYVGSLGQFRVHLENSVDTFLDCRQMIQLSRSVDIFVKRPNKFRANINGDLVAQEFYYDGATITLSGKRVNFYATLDAPETLEEAMDYAINSYGLIAPGVDLIDKNSYEVLTAEVISGSYVGLSTIFGVECHHLAFRGEATDWQIWIENSQKSLPKKIVYTRKLIAGAPQFTAILSGWDETPIKDDVFTFTAPENAEKIDFLPPGQ
ncbi:MAG: DUF2092 domain-containing protein [Deltaproteobacteria bacterium]|nr:DUF2092 domain-containing protein [Deltaproteobacteria bacterium]